MAVYVATACLFVGCASPADPGTTSQVGDDSAPATSTEETSPESDEATTDSGSQEETCDWDSAKISGSVKTPTAQDGELSEILVGSWQHTHTDEGSGFEEVVNDHRYVFPSPDRMLYCQHVPGATEYAENAADVTLNGAAIELPGGKYSYTVTAWDENTMLWDNPVGGGYVYLLQRR